MEPTSRSMKRVWSLLQQGQKVVAMCVHQGTIFVATEHQVYRLKPNSNVLEQLVFEQIND